MNKTTLAKLKLAAPQIEKYRQLDERDKEWLAPIIDFSVLTAIDILSQVEEQPLTFEEIAALTGLHPNSISQIINALSESIVIDMSNGKAYAPVGRKRKLVAR